MTDSRPFHVQEGYRGLLLHYISPRLAEAVYPYANLRLEVVMLLLLVSSAGLSTSTVISIVIPAQVGREAVGRGRMLLHPFVHPKSAVVRANKCPG